MQKRRLAQLLLFACASLSAAGGHACTEALRQFDIPAQPLRSALLQFGRQSGCSVVFDPSIVPVMVAPAVRGRLQVDDALARLLGGARLQVRPVSADVLAIVPSAPDVQTATAVAPPPPARPAAPEPQIATMIVTASATGSQIRGADYRGFAQLDVIAPEAIRSSGHQGVGELLRFLPAVAGNSTSTQVTNGGDGTASITLRGLPAANTLVLIDGRRTNSDAFHARAVDLNTLPLAMIERVEVLKDGASAVYGSDAIAGVVNVVTRRQVSGAELTAYYGESQRSDLATRQLSFVAGTDIGASNLMLALSSYTQDGVNSRDRARSRDADSRAEGGIDQRSTAAAYPWVVFDDAALVRTAADVADDDAFRPATDDDRFNHRAFTHAVVPSQRDNLFVRVQAPFYERFALSFDALISRTEANNRLAPVPLFSAFDGERTPVRADAPGNPFAVELLDVRRRMLEFGPREFRNASLSQRYIAVLEAAEDGFAFDLGLNYQRTAAHERARNLLRADRLARALGPAVDCILPCRPIDLLAVPGGIDTALVDYLRVNATSDAQSSLSALSGNLTFVATEMPAGPLQLAAGFDVRRETIDTDPDTLLRAGNVIGTPVFGPTRGDRGIIEAYVEALLPLLADEPWAEALDLSLAARFSRYSDFGNTVNPKLALRYRPEPRVLLRAAWSAGFRAPTLQQLFVATESSFDFLNDPCANALQAAQLPGCEGASDPTLVQFLTVRGGNRHLRPERARTLTFGLVLSPVPSLSASIDYYRIRQRDVVDANAQYVLNQNAFFGRFPARVSRDARGNLTKLLATPLNIGQRDVAGWDLSLHYSLELPALGALEFAINAAHIARFEDQLDPDTPAEDHAGSFSDEASSGNGSLPHWKSSAGVKYARPPWTVQYSAYYVGELRERLPGSANERRIDAWLDQNVQVAYSFGRSYDGEVALGVENLLDAAPPFAASAFNDSFDGRTYSLVGRYFYLRLTSGLR